MCGRVTLKEGVWRYDDFTGRVGKSDLGGSVSYRSGGKRPHITAELVSKRLSLGDFAPVIGKDKPKPGASAAPKGGKEQKAQATGPTGTTVLPQWKFSAEKWDTLDADVQFSGQSMIDFGRTPFENLKMRVSLEDRQLTLDPFEFGFAGGALSGKLVIDGRNDPMAARIDTRGRNLDLARLLPSVKNERMALGTVNGRAVLAGRGNSFAQLLGSADGEAQFAMGRGQISNLVLEIVDLDAAEALGFLVGGDKTVPVRCALFDVGFRNGVMESRTAVFDTEDTIVTAGGQVNFADETLNLHVAPVPKDPSPLTLRVPFDVKGTFKKRQISPDKGKLAMRAGAAIVLGAINPLAGLLPLIETGPGKNSDCAALVARAKGEGVPVKNERTAEPPAAGRKPAPQNRK
jgi:uncharacterized protein involved in outer membrane biogenesis